MDTVSGAPARRDWVFILGPKDSLLFLHTPLRVSSARQAGLDLTSIDFVEQSHLAAAGALKGQMGNREREATR